MFLYLENSPQVGDSVKNVEQTMELLAILNMYLINEENVVSNGQELVKFFQKCAQEAACVFTTKKANRLLVLEGNIGVGKTTTLNRLVSENNLVEIVAEPLDFWHKILVHNPPAVKKNIFEEFYQTLAVESETIVVFIFQIIALYSRLTYLVHSYQHTPETSVLISERSFLSDRYKVP